MSIYYVCDKSMGIYYVCDTQFYEACLFISLSASLKGLCSTEDGRKYNQKPAEQSEKYHFIKLI